jgi:hypothetical protein
VGITIRPDAGSDTVQPWRSGQHNPVEGPEKPDFWGEALLLVDAAYQPLAAEDAVVHVVLVDAMAKAGRAHQPTKTEQARILEESKAEAARILEVIKTGNNSDKAAVNLKFLLDAGLISDADRRKNIEGFLVSRVAGEGPALPSQTSAEEVTRKMF